MCRLIFSGTRRNGGPVVSYRLRIRSKGKFVPISVDMTCFVTVQVSVFLLCNSLSFIKQLSISKTRNVLRHLLRNLSSTELDIVWRFVAQKPVKYSLINKCNLFVLFCSEYTDFEHHASPMSQRQILAHSFIM